MANLIKLLVLVVLFAGLGLAIAAFGEMNVKPTLQGSRTHLALTVIAALVLGPIFAALAGDWARKVLRDDLQEVVDSQAPHVYRVLADMALNNPIVYYGLIAIFIGGTFGYGTWGAAALYERRQSDTDGTVTCAVEAARAENNSRMRLRLNCPGSDRREPTELLVQGFTSRLPQELVLPLRKGALGTRFIDGSDVRF